MDSELRDLIEKTHALAKDNHRMLRALRRGQMFSFLSSIVVWIAVIVLPIYFYQQYLAPIVSNLSSLSGMSTTTTSGLIGVPTFNELKNLINSIKSEQ